MLGPGLLVIGTTLPAVASEAAASARPDRIVRVGVEGIGPPFSFRGVDHAPAGYAIDLLEAIAREEKFHIDWVMKNWPDLLEDFKAGRIDVLGNVGYSAERSAIMDFSATTVRMAPALYLRKGDADLRSLADLRGKRICALEKSIAWDYISRQDWGVTLVPALSRAEVAAALVEGRADVALMMGAIMDHYLRTTDYGLSLRRSQVAPRDEIYDMHIGVRKDRPEILDWINQGLLRVVRADADREIHQRWIGPLQARRLTWRQARLYLLVLAGLIGLIVAAFGLLAWQRQRLRLIAAQAAELRRRETELRTITDAVPALIAYLDPSRRYVRVNLGYELFFHRSAAEIVGLTVRDLLPPEAARRADELIDRGLAGEAVSMHHHVTLADGEEKFLQANIIPDFGPDGRVMGCLHIGFDLTERDRTETRLALESAALQAMANAVVITDARGRVWWANQAHETLTGYSLAEYRDHDLCELVRPCPQAADFSAGLWATVHEGRVWRGECRHRRKDGELFIEQLSVTPLRDDQGQITHCVAIREDITGQKRLLERFLHSQRQESLGRLANGIAHDLNNILTPVLLAPAMLRERLGDPQAAKLIDMIEANTRRGSEVLKQLITIGRGSEVFHEWVDLAQVVEALLRTIRHTFPATLAIETRCAADLPRIRGDATRLHQVVLNLCVNARDAMPAGGVLTLALTERELDAAAVAAMPEGRPGRFLALSVADTGTGIPPENQQRIFEPFYTTKAPGEGTGLGLSTVLGLVRSHGGFINLESEPGRGSCFTVYLPVTGEVPEAPAPDIAPAAAQPAGRGRRILLVDDEAYVVQTLKFMLEKQGYRTQQAANGFEAMKLYHAATEPFDAVITDLMMPGMDGTTFVRTLRQINPRIRILVISGQATMISVGSDLAGLANAIVAKPFTADDILRQLERSLPPPEQAEGGRPC